MQPSIPLTLNNFLNNIRTYDEVGDDTVAMLRSLSPNPVLNLTFVNVRADQLTLGDTIVLPDVLGATVSPEYVTRLELIGDDVEINGVFTTSVSNKVTILDADGDMMVGKQTPA